MRLSIVLGWSSESAPVKAGEARKAYVAATAAPKDMKIVNSMQPGAPHEKKELLSKNSSFFTRIKLLLILPA